MGLPNLWTWREHKEDDSSDIKNWSLIIKFNNIQSAISFNSYLLSQFFVINPQSMRSTLLACCTWSPKNTSFGFIAYTCLLDCFLGSVEVVGGEWTILINAHCLHGNSWNLIPSIGNKRLKEWFLIILHEWLPCVLCLFSFVSSYILSLLQNLHSSTKMKKWNGWVLSFIVVVVLIVWNFRFFVYINHILQYSWWMKPFFFPVTLLYLVYIICLESKSIVW